jgi:hypothetical protein
VYSFCDILVFHAWVCPLFRAPQGNKEFFFDIQFDKLGLRPR